MADFNDILQKIYSCRGSRANEPLFYRKMIIDRCAEMNVDLSKLKFVHIAGTKGKGSTAAFIEQILRDQGLKTGLFTSPHLITPCERIQINGKAISEQIFSKSFHECFERTEPSQTNLHFFQILFLMSLKVFFDEKIDVGIIEVGIGGANDVTNLIHPRVCAITLIDFDHTNLLGNTITEIATQKAGIIKHGIPIVTTNTQTKEASDVFEKVAKEQTAPLFVVGESNFPCLSQIELGIAGDHQRTNAAIAIKVCKLFGESQDEKAATGVDENVKISLQQTFWPGRSQIIDIEPGLQLYLDGAHTLKSIQACCKWYSQSLEKETEKSNSILLFNTSHNRDFSEFLDEISCFRRTDGSLLFDYCIFTNFDTKLSAPPEYQVIDLQESMKQKWEQIAPSVSSEVCGDIPSAIEKVKTLHSGLKIDTKVLVTGSLYLIGGIMQVLNKSR